MPFGSSAEPAFGAVCASRCMARLDPMGNVATAYRLELRPFVPAPLEPEVILARRISAWTPDAGPVGMGGAGFVGFDLGGDWLMIALWQASLWIRVDGEVLFDMLYSLDGSFFRPRVDVGSVFVGDQFTHVSVERRRVVARLATGRELLIADDPPIPRYMSGAVRKFGESDDLRRAVFLSPSPDLWAS